LGFGAVKSLAILLGCLSVASLAHAQPQPRSGAGVTIALPACRLAGWSNNALLDALRLELESTREVDRVQIADSASVAPSFRLALDTDCREHIRARQGGSGSSAEVRLSVTDPDGGHVSRVFELRDIPAEVQLRSLALAAAELVRAGIAAWSGHVVLAGDARGEPAPVAAPDAVREVDLTPQPLAAKDDTPDSESVDAGAPAEPQAIPTPKDVATPTHPTSVFDSEFSLFLRPAFRVFVTHGDAMFGGELALRWRRFAVGTACLLGWYSDLLGTARVGSATVFVSYEPIRVRASAFEFAAGPRVALGPTWATTTATSASSGSATWLFAWEVAIELAVSYALADSWALALRGNIGFGSGARFQADDRELADLYGVFVGTTLSVGASLP
jgi:hypothetical protein